jgi:hypothetical protein
MKADVGENRSGSRKRHWESLAEAKHQQGWRA